MAKKRIHRVAIYVLDSERKRVMLHKQNSGPFVGQYYVPTAPINDSETPLETARKVMSQFVDFDFCFLGHGPSMPIVLDERSMKIFPPLHVQVTAADEETDLVDYVYLGHAQKSPEFVNNDSLGWFNSANIKQAPMHIRQVVHHILGLMNFSQNA